MKTLMNRILFIVISIIIIIFFSMFLISKKEVFSEEENRYLEKFDLEKIDEYLSDHFPMRKDFISLKNHTKKFIGKTLINNVYAAKNNYFIPVYEENKNKDYIIKAINDFSKNYNNVDVMIVPDSVFINKELLAINIEEDEESEINYLYSKLKNSNNINVINALKEGNKTKQMYYKTDHHWTTYGAYVAYQEYYNQKGENSFIESDFNIKKVSDHFLGTSSSLTYGLAKKEDIVIFEKDANLVVNYVNENKITDTLYNYEYLSKKDKYSMFLDNNHALIEITNNSLDTNNSILIIKNSYANAFVPFIVNHYKNVYVIDLRYYSGIVSNYVNENNIEDILILYNLNNMYADMSIVKLK